MKDHIAALQTQSAESNTNIWGYWGPDRDKYSTWTSHSNRLIPAYTFGLTLDAVNGANSLYRDEPRLSSLYGRLPSSTLNADAEYFDQTDIYRLQKLAAEAGKKRIILFVFDGMDWQTTRAAAIAKSRQVGYDEGRGSGLHFQDYRGPQPTLAFRHQPTQLWDVPQCRPANRHQSGWKSTWWLRCVARWPYPLANH
ncbi:MAG: hypothetical protein R3C56_39505 [Pirellulaceae bacterium]